METLKKEILNLMGVGDSAKGLTDTLNANGYDVKHHQVLSALRALALDGMVEQHKRNGFWKKAVA